MDRKIAGLLGGVAAVATMTSAQAATGPAPNPSAAPQASSYADLLAPIPNAAELLKADDALRVQQQAEVQLAQVYYAPYAPPYASYRHHHHHHHHVYRRYSHHHHHHHHHHVVVGVPGVGGVVVR